MKNILIASVVLSFISVFVGVYGNSSPALDIAKVLLSFAVLGWVTIILNDAKSEIMGTGAKKIMP